MDSGNLEEPSLVLAVAEAATNDESEITVEQSQNEILSLESQINYGEPDVSVIADDIVHPSDDNEIIDLDPIVPEIENDNAINQIEEILNENVNPPPQINAMVNLLQAAIENIENSNENANSNQLQIWQSDDDEASNSNSNQNEWRPEQDNQWDDSDSNQNEIAPYIENIDTLQPINSSPVIVVNPNIPERILQSTRILERVSGMANILTDEQNSLLNTHHSIVQQLQDSLGNTSWQPINITTNSSVVVVDESPSRKKRKRTPEKAVKKSPSTSKDDDDEDDGLTCPICLDHWEMCGLHRLTSLKCGHLFGYSCIKRWISGNSHAARNCPTCKTKASMRDIRYVYARRVCVRDNTEEYRLKDLLEQERLKYGKLQMECGITKVELDLQKKLCADLKEKIDLLQNCSNNLMDKPQNTYDKTLTILSTYKLFLEKNIEITREPGCRVMLFGNRSKLLMVSQKSSQSLFPGFGIRFIDTPTFRPSQFIHMSCKTVRGLSFNLSEDLLISATMDRGAKLFNINTKSIVNVFSPSDKPLWSCAFDRERANFLYLGTQHGSTYVYDLRNSMNYVEEFSQPGDLHPVINICPIPPSQQIPCGGFLVCKLQSLWFYEYTVAQQVISTKLNIDGPFISMNYDESTSYILISTRPNSKNPTSRYILAHLRKINDLVTLHIVDQFNGSRLQTVMSRSTQVNIENGCIVAAYLQDTKMLTTWGINSDSSYMVGRNQNCGGIKLQSLPVSDSVLDTCPIYCNSNVYLGALTENKCRIYRFNNI